MGYEPRPGLPGYWSYDGLEIQADVDTHRFVVGVAGRMCAPGASALDIGAGAGALSKQLVDAGLSVSCTTWDDRVRLDIPKYPLDLDYAFGPDKVGGVPFDLVCCVEVIEHVENPAALLRSCRAVVAPSGRVVLTTPNVESAPARLQWLFRGCPLMFQTQEVVRNRHISMLWRQGLEFQIDRAGFEIVEKHLIGQPNFRSGLQRVVKGLAFRLMRGLFSGELDGESRIYVLAPKATAAKAHGPGDVY
jgi:SAM-dependent methyltransferase